MTPAYADFTRASDLIHAAQGAALLLLGVAQFLALKNNGRRWTMAAAVALALAGAAMFAAVLGLPGGWSFAALGEALAFRSGFYVFLAFSFVFTAAGLSLLTHEALGRSGGWQAVFLALLAFAGALYFLLAWRVNEAAWRAVLLRHSVIGATLLLAVAARAAAFYLRRPALNSAWAALLLLTGLQLISYREAEETFGPRLVTIQTSPEMRPSPASLENAKPVDKERAVD
jgi:hypothetical protein